MKFGWAASAALLLACACASDPSGAAPKPAKVAAAKPAKAMSDPDKVVCKSQDVLGRHTSVEVCHTKAEWAAIRKGQTAGVADTQRSIQGASGISGGAAPSAPQ